MLRPVICLCDPKAAKGGKTIIIWLWNLQDFHHTYKLIFPLSVDYLERCMLETSERSATCLCPRRASVFGQPVSVIKQHLSNEVSRKFSNVPSSVPKAFRLARIHVWICWGNVKAISREFKVGKKKSYYYFLIFFFFFTTGRKIFVMDKPHLFLLWTMFHWFYGTRKPQLHLTPTCLINLQNRTHACARAAWHIIVTPLFSFNAVAI